MTMAVLLETSDTLFAQNLTKMLQQWGLGVFHHGDGQGQCSLSEREQVEIILLDIRHASDNTAGQLLSIRENLPGAEIILINSHDNIRASMDAMQAGASDEIFVPCDTGILKEKITDALQRRKKLAGKKKRLSFFRALGESMAAATFAQAGEFDAAIDYMKESRTASENQDRELPTADKRLPGGSER